MVNNNHNSDEPMVIGITMGEPLGIGPEIIVKALYDPLLRRQAKFIIFGMDEFLEYAADWAEIEPYWGRCQHEKISRDYPHNVVVADYDDYSSAGMGKRPKQGGRRGIAEILRRCNRGGKGRHNRCSSYSADKQSKLETGGGRMAGTYRTSGGTVQKPAKGNDVCRGAVENRTCNNPRGTF